MRQLLFLISFVAMSVSCSDFYVSHDYPVYTPAITAEQAQWIKFGLDDSVIFIDSAGTNRILTVSSIDSTPQLDWEGSIAYKTLELHGINYNYTPRMYYAEFSIDTIFCWVLIILDSAKLSYPDVLNIRLRIAEESIDITGQFLNVTRSSVVIANKNYSTFLYNNVIGHEPIREVCVTPEFGILWIKFKSGDEWRNSAL